MRRRSGMRANHPEWISPNGYKWADGYFILAVSPTHRHIGTTSVRTSTRHCRSRARFRTPRRTISARTRVRLPRSGKPWRGAAARSSARSWLFSKPGTTRRGCPRVTRVRAPNTRGCAPGSRRRNRRTSWER
ncbi:DUF5129 domain-containing protein [Actinomyces bouchesdurhonensis]|uniref:DUF5129 domain-containing protein n=1 Tax=Actinomyces bouchesdurhonensis TaxID=1852361 RepID=UPI0028E9CFD2|nr:DUF5129 domain-containing protein [Actinomyces bouchesdurhonensis]